MILLPAEQLPVAVRDNSSELAYPYLTLLLLLYPVAVVRVGGPPTIAAGAGAGGGVGR
jgi:hypothetical protein